MTYKEVLADLKIIGYDEIFKQDIESNFSESFLERLNRTDRIHSPGSLIRTLISEHEAGSEKWEFWRKVFIYFINPEFVRKKEMLPKITNPYK